MVNAQEWLDQNNPKEQRNKIIELNISEKKLEGSLDLQEFPSLEWLDCHNNQITSLNISNCKNLEALFCDSNKLTSLDLTSCQKLKMLECSDNYLKKFNYFSCNPDKLTLLNVSDNNLPRQDLSVFSRFSKLEHLGFGNRNEVKIKGNVYNRFFGSLEPLKDLKRLRSLLMSNTDIEESLEYLPNNIKRIYCSTEINARRAKKIVEQLNNSTNFFLIDEEECKYGSAQKNNAQEWLDKNYPREIREEIKYLDISQANLEGLLVLEGFSNLEKLDCSDNDLTGLDMSYCPNLQN